jgi:hypothetical protein
MNGDVIKDMDRGPVGERAKDMDRGVGGGGGGAADSAAIANDLFQRASQLGGLLVVAVVAPMAPRTGPTNGSSSIQRALLGIAPTLSEEPAKVRPAKQPVQKARGLAERRAMLSGSD